MNKKIWAEKLSSIFFWMQLPVAIVFGFPQFFHVLKHGSEGVSPVMMICGALFCLFLLLLTLDAMRIKATLNMKRYLVICGTGLFNYGLMIGALVWIGFPWKQSDNVVTVLVSLSIVGAVLWLLRKKGSPSDPQFKGMIAIVLKAVPQLFMAYRIYDEGNSGLGAFFVGIFHFFCILRLVVIRLEVWVEGWNTPRKWLWWSELGNYGSWIVVTYVWLR